MPKMPKLHLYTIVIDANCDIGTGLTPAAQTRWANGAIAEIVAGVAAATDGAALYQTPRGDVVVQSLDRLDWTAILGELGIRAAYTSVRVGRTFHHDQADVGTRKLVGRRMSPDGRRVERGFEEYRPLALFGEAP